MTILPRVNGLPPEIQVWRNNDKLDHLGTWATTRYPAEAVTYVPKADAQAAVALVLTGIAPPEDTAAWAYGEDRRSGYEDAMNDIRTLAPTDGLALVAELRAEIKRLTGCLKTANDNHEHFEREWYLEKDERDRLAADNARLAALTDRLCAEADRLYLEGKQELPGPKLRAIANV